MNIWHTLSPDEETTFRQWAKENYTPGTPVNPLWHLVVRDECERMNAAQGRMSTNTTLTRIIPQETRDHVTMPAQVQMISGIVYLFDRGDHVSYSGVSCTYGHTVTAPQLWQAGLEHYEAWRKANAHYHVIPDAPDPLPDQTGMTVYYETEQDATDAANDETHPHHVISCTDPACKE